MDSRRVNTPGTGRVMSLVELGERLLDIEDAIGELQDVLDLVIQKVGLEPLNDGEDICQQLQEH